MSDELKNKLAELDDEQLIDVIINYKKYHYPEETRELAYKILKARKIPRAEIDKIAEKYLEINQEIKYTKEQLRRIYRKYHSYAWTTIICFFLPVIFILLSFIIGVPIVQAVFPYISLVFTMVTYVFHALAMNQNIMFRSIVEGEERNKLVQGIVYYLLVFPISPIIIIYNILWMNKNIKTYGSIM